MSEKLSAPAVLPKSSLHNVFALGKVAYIPAKIEVQSAYERLELIVTTVAKVLWVVLLSGPIILWDMKHVLIPRAKKNVFGQTALVRISLFVLFVSCACAVRVCERVQVIKYVWNAQSLKLNSHGIHMSTIYIGHRCRQRNRQSYRTATGA